MSSTTAGAFDVRNIIGALIGIYGVILLIAAFAMDPGINPENGMPKNSDYNLYAGAAMLAVGVGFFVWSMLRPITVAASETESA
ncbi:hypothetical protein [Corynebacterium freiburgense]|uniref:hypothetical protein n=1 Tax=Corynebacterium freiburgense TaxID=556548 RepID=UPI000425002D|nr:hypothetical protein [Corynebacterium freiburgense]WJZ02931.1 hypothetical protein CFREI_08265 [Corynebacterium freiburgense]